MRGTGGVLRAAIPIVIEFDEREFVGVLQGVIQPESLLASESSRWSALIAAAGDLIVQQGATWAQRSVPVAAEMTLPEFGRMTQRASTIDFPPGGEAPQWRVLIAEPHDALYRPIHLLRATCMLLTTGSALLMVSLVVIFSRRQRALVVKLAHEKNQREAVAQLGQTALGGLEIDKLMGEAVALVANTLGTEDCTILVLPPEGAALLLMPDAGWKDGKRAPQP